MPIRLHLLLVTLLGVLGLLGGFGLGMLGLEALGPALPAAVRSGPGAFVVGGMLPAALGHAVLKGAFVRLVPAACPRCGGRADFRGSRRQEAVLGGSTTLPIAYVCRDCGHVHRTRVTEGSPDHLP